MCRQSSGLIGTWARRLEAAVVANGHAGAAAGRAARAVAGYADAGAGGPRRPGSPAQADEPGGAVPVAFERLEERQHFLVGAPVAPGQRPADHVLEVVVADGDRVRVARGPLPRLRRGPHADAWDGPQLPVGFLMAQREQSLQAVGHARGPNDGLGADALHAGPVPVPGRNAAPRSRVGEDAHAARRGSRGRRAVLRQQDPPGAVGFEHDDLLLEYRGDEQIHQAAGTADPQPWVPPRGVTDHWVRVGGEAGGVVVTAESAG